MYSIYYILVIDFSKKPIPRFTRTTNYFLWCLFYLQHINKSYLRLEKGPLCPGIVGTKRNALLRKRLKPEDELFASQIDVRVPIWTREEARLPQYE